MSARTALAVSANGMEILRLRIIGGASQRSKSGEWESSWSFPPSGMRRVMGWTWWRGAAGGRLTPVGGGRPGRSR
ncbi:hypothetical protein GCM10022205_35890 [Spinactinospora alkalitolerans]